MVQYTPIDFEKSFIDNKYICVTTYSYECVLPGEHGDGSQCEYVLVAHTDCTFYYEGSSIAGSYTETSDNNNENYAGGSGTTNNTTLSFSPITIPYEQQISNCLGSYLISHDDLVGLQFNFNDWLNSTETTYLEKKRVATFLENNNCSDEVVSFILEIMERMLNEQTDENYILGIIKENSFENTQLDCIFEKLKDQNNGDNFFKKMLKEFGGMFANLSFAIGDSSNNESGFTKSETINYGVYQVNDFVITSTNEIENSSNLNKMVNLSH